MKLNHTTVVDRARPEPFSHPVDPLITKTGSSLLLIEAIATINSCVTAAAELDQNRAVDITRESRLEKVIERLAAKHYDAVIYDLALSNDEGFADLDRIVGACAKIPLVVLCEQHTVEQGKKALRHGAQEYLVKGTEAIRSLQHVLNQAMLRKQWERKLIRSARYDYLTGLPDRILFREQLEQAILDAQRNLGQMGILFVNLDQFKEINNTLGHEIGDDLLKLVTERIRQCVRSADSVARSGGDEFAIIANRLNPATDAANLAKRINTSLARP